MLWEARKRGKFQVWMEVRLASRQHKLQRSYLDLQTLPSPKSPDTIPKAGVQLVCDLVD
jgi:hypothetical protein